MRISDWSSDVCSSDLTVLAQVGKYLLHAFPGQRVLVAGLRGGQHKQGVQALVLDQRLLERSLTLDHVDEVIHDPSLATHDQVEVAQADRKRVVWGKRGSVRVGLGGGRTMNTKKKVKTGEE